ncbi:MAG: DnaB-like helicase C-terminal domain-containing protein [Erysipelotrichaceae bacterium]|nr:DnaB-like helicase C-terminal domain-containing protein [Erysipelotrichaceae bacterium]
MKKNSIEQLPPEKFAEMIGGRTLSPLIGKFRIHGNPELHKRHYPSGFGDLDYKMFGGFTPGLHFLGAVSSLGKSTFALQMAANLAERGIPVMFISLEMDKEYLLAKILSSKLYRNTSVNSASAKTANQILSEATEKFTDEDWKCYDEALREIAEYGDNLIILENQIDPVTVEDVKVLVRKFIDTYHVKPFVIIDYLQILSSKINAASAGERMATENKIIALRSLAKENDIPVLVISSLNRENYSTKANMASFKETGLIEYSADTLLALQFKGVEEAGFDVEEAKTRYPREIELKILKQRYGETGVSIDYEFYPKYSYFREIGITFRPAKKDEIKTI